MVLSRLRWLAAWCLYWTGDLFWCATLLIDSEKLYGAYQKAMALSSDIQGPTSFGPWSTGNPKD